MPPLIMEEMPPCFSTTSERTARYTWMTTNTQMRNISTACTRRTTGMPNQWIGYDSTMRNQFDWSYRPYSARPVSTCSRHST